MLSDISFFLARQLYANKFISQDEMIIYRYGIEVFFLNFITLSIAIIAGLVLKSFLASMLFFLCFAILRSFCGGYHASTSFKCNAIYFVVILYALFLFRCLPVALYETYNVLSCILSSVITSVYAPVDNSNKKITKNKAEILHILSMIVTVFYIVVATILIMHYHNSYGVVLDSVLLIASISMFVTNPTRGG